MSDALERLKQRNRPSVPKRDATLKAEQLDTEVLESQDISTPRSLESKNPKKRSKPFSTKQSTIRLEASLSERLQKVCRNSGVSREVFIEAMFEYCEKNSETFQDVMETAREKNEQRQQMANLRRAKSMMQRFS